MARSAKKGSQSIYERLFFDRMLGAGVVFLAMTYITRGSWASAFLEAATIMIGIVWSYRAITTNRSVVFRLLAALVMLLIGSLLAVYLGRVHGLV